MFIISIEMPRNKIHFQFLLVRNYDVKINEEKKKTDEWK